VAGGPPPATQSGICFCRQTSIGNAAVFPPVADPAEEHGRDRGGKASIPETITIHRPPPLPNMRLMFGAQIHYTILVVKRAGKDCQKGAREAIIFRPFPSCFDSFFSLERSNQTLRRQKKERQKMPLR